MNIAVVGSGNIGTLLAAQLSLNKKSGDFVKVYTSRPMEWNSNIKVLDSKDNLLYTSSKIDLCSDNMEEVLRNVEWVFVTVPSFMFPIIADRMEPYIYSGIKVCIVPGNGGAEHFFQNICKKGAVLCAFERVHATAGLRNYGKVVQQRSLKKQIRIAIMPNLYLSGKEAALMIETMLPVKCSVLPNFLCASLAPSNPILHTTRLYRLFQDYKGQGYAKEMFMCDTWDDETSEILFACDNELQNICKDLDQLDLSEVPSLKEYYESYTIHDFSEKMRSISAFRGAKAPMKYIENGWHPDFNSRLFLADIEFGLQFMKEIGQCSGTKTPIMNKILEWYERITRKKISNILKIHTKEELYRFYKSNGNVL